tara:strand:+ start:358 stop:516 length:159 start_codon:yes stop_codon:yes gene_type:complete
LGKSQAFFLKIGDILGNLGTLDDLDTQKKRKKKQKKQRKALTSMWFYPYIKV